MKRLWRGTARRGIGLSVWAALGCVCGNAWGAPASTEPSVQTPPADAWWEGAAERPRSARGTPDAVRFETLSGMPQEGGVRFVWRAPSESAPSGSAPEIWWSTDTPGGWKSRDWRRAPMAREGDQWAFFRRLDSARVPVVYFVTAEAGDGMKASPMRLFEPARVPGWEPAVAFSGHLEGFEGDLDGWELASGREAVVPLEKVEPGWVGRQALRVVVPAGRGSVTVGTTRVRGWMLTEQPVEAIRVALRTESGSGRVRAALHSRTGTRDLAVHAVHGDFAVGKDWVRWEIPLEAFARLDSRGVDRFTLQFLAEPGTALLLDEVELVLR